jgi:hypothetical protein
MAASTSAPSDLAAQVTEALSGLGPLSVVRRQVISQVTPDHEVPRRALSAGPAAPATATLADDGLGLA